MAKSPSLPPPDRSSGDPLIGQGPPPPNPFQSTSFIPPGRNGWAQNHQIDPTWEPGTGKPQLVFNPDDIRIDDTLTVGGGRAIDAILAGPIANNPPGSPGEPYIPSIFVARPFVEPLDPTVL